MFDEAYCQKLDQKKYVSPSRDRKQPFEADDDNRNEATMPEDHLKKDSSVTGEVQADKHADVEKLDIDEEDSDNDATDIPEGSLFEYNIPGVMTKDEVSKLDLAHWKLRVRTSLIDLEVWPMEGFLCLS